MKYGLIVDSPIVYLFVWTVNLVFHSGHEAYSISTRALVQVRSLMVFFLHIGLYLGILSTEQTVIRSYRLLGMNDLWCLMDEWFSSLLGTLRLFICLRRSLTCLEMLLTLHRFGYNSHSFRGFVFCFVENCW